MNKLIEISLGAIALCFSAPAWAAGTDWTVSEASGRVVTRDASGDHPIARGSVIPAGATLVTGSGARAVLVRGDDFVTVSAASRVRVPDAKSPSMVQMFVEWGTGLFKVKHTDKPHFGVKTPYLAAVVKGTTFTVTVSQDGSSLQVLDGAVGVTTIDGGANELIRPGMVAVISANDLYRLTVQGQTSRTIDSPMRGNPTSPKAEDPPKISEASPASPIGAPAQGKNSDDFAWGEVANSVITAPVEAKPVDLGTVTGGLVSNGSASATVAMSAAVPVVPGPAVVSGRGSEATRADPVKGKDDAKPDPGKGADDVKPDSGKGEDNAEPNPGKGSDGTKPDPGKGKDDAKPDPGKSSDDVKPDPGKGKDDAKPDPGKGGDDAKPDPGKGKDDAKPDPGKGGDDAKPDPGKRKDDVKPDPGKGSEDAKPDPGKGSEDAKPDSGKGKDDAKPEPGKTGGNPGKGGGGAAAGDIEVGDLADADVGLGGKSIGAGINKGKGGKK